MNPRRRKSLTIFFCVFAVIAGVIAWRTVMDREKAEIHLIEQTQRSLVPTQPIYLVRNLTDDTALTGLYPQASVMVHAGTFPATGAYFTRSDFPPRAYRGRTVNLLFEFDGTSQPGKTDTLARQMIEVARLWRRHGAKIGELVIDASRMKTPDITTLGAIAADIRAESKREFSVGVYLRRSWIENNPENSLRAWNISKYVRTFYFDAKDSEDNGDSSLENTINALSDILQFPFIVHTDGKTDPILLMQKHMAQTKYFVGIMADPLP